MGIEVKNVSKYYGTDKALENVSFKAERGEVLALLGPNGAGKTSLMRIISCFFPPSSGDVLIDGYSVLSDSTRVRRLIGYLPENNPLYPDMGVLEILTFLGSLSGIKGQFLQKRLRDTVILTGLEEAKHKKIRELSKGFRQRVGIAQAIIHDPELLILDEPTGGLDPNQIVEIRRLIMDLGKSKTVIISTHILSEAEAACSKIIILNKGKVVASGTENEIKNSGRKGKTLRVKISAPDTDEEIIRQIRGIKSVRDVQALSGGCFLLSFTDEENPQNLIFRLVSDRGWTLAELGPGQEDLEEIFKKLTK